MARPEPQFDIQKVTHIRMTYPPRQYRDRIIKQESEQFRKIIKNALKKNNIHVNFNIEDDVFVCPRTGMRTDREWSIK